MPVAAPPAPLDPARLRRMANGLRALSMDAVERARSGHPGLPMGAADVAAVLFDRHLTFDAADPAWSNRDRFVLSAGHGSMLLYAALHLLGYPGWGIEELKAFRQLGSRTPGHPEITHAIEGVETTTGPLGQGLATAVGMALAERVLNARFGDALVGHRTYVLASDGDLMEGISHEAIALAGHLRLARLIVLWDDNGISIDGPLSLSDSTDQIKRFEASGWATVSVDGHDAAAIDAALEAAKRSDRPTLVACRTTIGFGAPTKAGKSAAHGSPLGAEELAGAKRALGWEAAPFEVPGDVRAAWAEAAARGGAARAAFEAGAAKVGRAERAEFERVMKGEAPRGLAAAVRDAKRRAAANEAPVATRKASEEALAAIAPAVPELVLGSADLTPSNNTRLPGAAAIAAPGYEGSFVHWGIREHAMAAAMNGMSLHGGLIPASGTFLVFADYCRPALRMAALMERRVVHVMTHDSIGVGEDGPTHQPVEHLASLRAIPNLRLYRPADRAEAAEAWECAITDAKHPSVLALSRQDLPRARAAFTARNLTALGAYELLPAEGKAQVSLFASGSEVSLAVEARALLAADGIGARVVSVPCLDRFLEQPEAYRRRVIGRARAKVAVEAGLRLGWDAVIGPGGRFVGMTGFGISGPYKQVYEHFGITAGAVAEAARAALGTKRVA